MSVDHSLSPCMYERERESVCVYERECVCVGGWVCVCAWPRLTARLSAQVQPMLSMSFTDIVREMMVTEQQYARTLNTLVKVFFDTLEARPEVLPEQARRVVPYLTPTQLQIF